MVDQQTAAVLTDNTKRLETYMPFITKHIDVLLYIGTLGKSLDEIHHAFPALKPGVVQSLRGMDALIYMDQKGVGPCYCCTVECYNLISKLMRDVQQRAEDAAQKAEDRKEVLMERRKQRFDRRFVPIICVVCTAVLNYLLNKVDPVMRILALLEN